MTVYVSQFNCTSALEGIYCVYVCVCTEQAAFLMKETITKSHGFYDKNLMN